MKTTFLFTVTTEGRRDLDLCRFAEDFVNRLWIPDHLTPAQAAEYALDYFRRTVAAELKLLVVIPALNDAVSNGPRMPC